MTAASTCMRSPLAQHLLPLGEAQENLTEPARVYQDAAREASSARGVLPAYTKLFI